MFLVTDLSRKFPRTVKLDDTKDVVDVIIGVTGNPAAGHTAELIAAGMTFGEGFTCRDSFKLRCVTDDEAETWVEEPAPVNMEQKLRDIIAAHNRMIETIQNAEMTCNLFRGMEVWHKIACEGADITSAARSIGIDAKVNMQSGEITVLENPVGKIPATDAFIESGMSLSEIISNLRDQVKDRENSIDEDDPDCIFHRDVAALRVAAELLERFRVQR